MLRVTPEAALAEQGLSTAADAGSRCGTCLLAAKVLRLPSAADGYLPVREPAQGAVGHRPRTDHCKDDREPRTDGEEVDR